MNDIFQDISKYYAANILENVLIIGRIVYRDEMYHFARDDVQGPFNLVDPEADVTRMVHVIGEIHPRSAVEKIFPVEVNSCLYLNENEGNGEIEVRSIHKGMGTAIFSRQQCPLIFWNPNFKDYEYFDVIDIQNVFNEDRLKNSFSAILAESLEMLVLYRVFQGIFGAPLNPLFQRSFLGFDLLV